MINRVSPQPPNNKLMHQIYRGTQHIFAPSVESTVAETPLGDQDIPVRRSSLLRSPATGMKRMERQGFY